MYPVLRIGKLDIRHDTPKSADDLEWLKIYNVYWGDRFLGAKIPTGYTVILPHGYVSIVTKPSTTYHRHRFKGFYFHANLTPKDHPRRWMNRFVPLHRVFKAWRWYRAWQAAINKEIANG